MTTIILIRHGETDWNKEKIFRGRIDVKLNENGKTQSKHLAKVLSNFKIDAIYSSPLSRALETAKSIRHLCENGIIPNEGFIDINYGDWQGLSHKQVIETYPKIYEDWIKNPEKVNFPNGETLKDVKNRSFAALNEIAQQHEDGVIVIVAHRVVCKVILCAMLGIDVSHFWHLKQDTCCINIIEKKNNRFIIDKMNDTCHLKEIGKDKEIDF